MERPLLPFKAKEIDEIIQPSIQFSVCTLVNDFVEYAEMLESFKKAGFSDDCTEFIYIDNSKSNKYEAFSGLNRFLQEAKGEYIILCHQDILLKYDNKQVLVKRLEELEQKDPSWGLAGNAGGYKIRHFSIKISEASGMHQYTKQFPVRVKSLDENFIIVKRKANLALSGDLQGFHLYGTDLCTIAAVLGYNAYTIDFHLLHKSSGNVNKSFYDIKAAYISKYQKVLQGTFIQTTITNFYISGNSKLNKLMNSKFMFFFLKHYFRPSRSNRPSIKFEAAPASQKKSQ